MITANGWGRREAVAHLTMNFVGDANVALNALPMEVQTDYDLCTKAMSERFDLPENMAHLHRAELESRIRRKGESLPALAQDISRLADLAYPGCSAWALADVAVEGFIRALSSSQHRYTLRSMRPRTLEEAVHRAMELESHATLERMRSTGVHALVIDEVSAEQEASAPPVLAITGSSSKAPTPKDTQGKSSDAPKRKGWKPQCIACGAWGHFLKDCTMLKPFFEQLTRGAAGQSSTEPTQGGQGKNGGKRKKKKGKGKGEPSASADPQPSSQTSTSTPASKPEN